MPVVQQSTKQQSTQPAVQARESSEKPARGGGEKDARGAFNRYVGSLQGGKGGADAVHETAAAGVAGSGGALPFQDKIQQSFGSHDISGVQAHTGPDAVAANKAMGSQAFATGTDVAFGGSPDLHTAAHEAAHVVQQSAGVQLKGGVGQAGDPFERHADAVADTVVRGGSAEALLTQGAGGGTTTSASSSAPVQHKAAENVQFLGTPLDKKAPSTEPKPGFGEDAGHQRRFTPEQYIEMWEKEQGRKLTAGERETINRGCIGLTATNLSGGGNPLSAAEKTFANFDLAHKTMVEKNGALDALSRMPGGQGKNPPRYVVFAKLFWSNQSPDWEERLKPDPKAYQPDPKTGEIDMAGYEYRAQSRYKTDPATGAQQKSGYVNFDYGFWDEASQSFWHANHMQHKDPVRAASDPMKVLQSTREKFAKGYLDFDRIIFCVARANNYDPGLAAIAHAGG